MQIGDGVRVYWRGCPEELGSIWFIRMQLIIYILGPFCELVLDENKGNV